MTPRFSHVGGRANGTKSGGGSSSGIFGKTETGVSAAEFFTTSPSSINSLYMAALHNSSDSLIEEGLRIATQYGMAEFAQELIGMKNLSEEREARAGGDANATPNSKAPEKERESGTPGTPGASGTPVAATSLAVTFSPPTISQSPSVSSKSLAAALSSPAAHSLSGRSEAQAHALTVSVSPAASSSPAGKASSDSKLTVDLSAKGRKLSPSKPRAFSPPASEPKPANPTILPMPYMKIDLPDNLESLSPNASSAPNGVLGITTTCPESPPDCQNTIITFNASDIAKIKSAAPPALRPLPATPSSPAPTPSPSPSVAVPAPPADRHSPTPDLPKPSSDPPPEPPPPVSPSPSPSPSPVVRAPQRASASPSAKGLETEARRSSRRRTADPDYFLVNGGEKRFRSSRRSSSSGGQNHAGDRPSRPSTSPGHASLTPDPAGWAEPLEGEESVEESSDLTSDPEKRVGRRKRNMPTVSYSAFK